MDKAHGLDDQALVTGHPGEGDFIAGKLQPTAPREIIGSKRLIVAGDEGDRRLAPVPVLRATRGSERITRSISAAYRHRQH